MESETGLAGYVAPSPIYLVFGKAVFRHQHYHQTNGVARGHFWYWEAQKLKKAQSSKLKAGGGWTAEAADLGPVKEVTRQQRDLTLVK